MIVLPEGAFTVIPNAKEEKTQSGIIIPTESQEEANEGTIAFTSQELNRYQGCIVRYRNEFGEDIEIKGNKMKYFRDFNSSIYYVITDGDKE